MDQNEFTTLGEWQGYSKERVAALLMMDQRDRLLLQFRDPFPGMSRAMKICAKPVGGKLTKNWALIWIFKALSLLQDLFVIPLNWWIRF
ncbi:MAG: hypothetical protein ACPH79_07755, partial [Paracoccaceae bacterium]